MRNHLNPERSFHFLWLLHTHDACLRVWLPSLFCGVPVSFQPHPHPSMVIYIHTHTKNIYFFLTNITLCVCNFLCLESSFTFLYLMFKIQTHLWKQEDHVLRISITRIIYLSVPSYSPYSAFMREKLWVIRWVYNRVPSLAVQISRHFRSFRAVVGS